MPAISESVTPSQPRHLGWVDLLRILACFLVVLAHCCDPFVAQFNNNYYEFRCGATWGSMVRCCVPLFVMISGVLLLPMHMDSVTFYRKRLKRILVPFVVWSLVAPVLYYLYIKLGAQTVNAPIVDGIKQGLFTGEHTIAKMYSFVFNFNYDTTPLWYMYMLIGLYLFMPIIGAWLKQAQQKEIKLFLYLWGVSMCLPLIKMGAPYLGYVGAWGSQELLGVCDWNPYGTFYYFAGFLGYIVMAHYLMRYPLNWSWARTLSTSIPLFLAGYAITFYGFVKIQEIYVDDYSYLEIMWYFSGINVFMMTISVFLVFLKLKTTPSPFIVKLSALTFGIFLSHFFFVQVAYDVVYQWKALPPYLMIPVMAFLTFAVTGALMWLLSLNRWTRKAIM